MKHLKDIFTKGFKHQFYGNPDVKISMLTQQDKEVQKGSLFFAVKGFSFDGHSIIPKVIELGATCIVCEKLPENYNPTIAWVIVEDTRQAMGAICSAFYDHPSEKLNLIGVTGTNGKSSVATMLFQFFSHRGHKCGLISTIEYVIGDKSYNSSHTTPDPIKLNALYAQMVQEGCSYAFMEVSSIAVHQGRINGLHFKGAIFTNLSHDHLDYHGTFAEYIRCKKLWFDQLGSDAFALVNADDKNGKVMLQNTKAFKFSYSLLKPSDFKVRILEKDFAGTLLKIDDYEVWVSLVGEFNTYNLAAVYGMAYLLDIPTDEILTGLSLLKGAVGRFDRIQGLDSMTAIVDYAHTPDALENVLTTINKIRTGNEKLIVVFGCGGDRDKSKRPLMGEIAARLATRVIITSDNPRNEHPEQIISEIEKGIHPVDFKKVLKISDRKEAIRTAVAFASAGDVILVAGKGHEQYQEVKGQKTHFDDKEIIHECFRQLTH